MASTDPPYSTSKLVLPVPNSDLVYVAKRYVPTHKAQADTGITFVFGHNASGCKLLPSPGI